MQEVLLRLLLLELLLAPVQGQVQAEPLPRWMMTRCVVKLAMPTSVGLTKPAGLRRLYEPWRRT